MGNVIFDTISMIGDDNFVHIFQPCTEKVLSLTFLGHFNRLQPITDKSSDDKMFPTSIEMICNNIDNAESASSNKFTPKVSDWLDVAQLTPRRKRTDLIGHQRAINTFMHAYVNELKMKQCGHDSDSS